MTGLHDLDSDLPRVLLVVSLLYQSQLFTRCLMLHVLLLVRIRAGGRILGNAPPGSTSCQLGVLADNEFGFFCVVLNILSIGTAIGPPISNHLWNAF